MTDPMDATTENLRFPRRKQTGMPKRTARDPSLRSG
jgi:hypothetical protein